MPDLGGWCLCFLPYFVRHFSRPLSLIGCCSATVLFLFSLNPVDSPVVGAVGGSIMFLSALDVLYGAVGQRMILYWFYSPFRFDLSQAPYLNYFEVCI
jgi:hypothetical protein